jgi:hypothetical protein
MSAKGNWVKTATWGGAMPAASNVQQQNQPVKTRDAGDPIGAAVFDAVLFGVQQFHLGHGQMKQIGRKVAYQTLENVFRDDVFIAHSPL